MDSELITLLAEKLSTNTPIALVTVIDAAGSTPGKIGAMMLVQNDEVIAGTVGGGSLEHQQSYNEFINATHANFIKLNTSSAQHRQAKYSLDE